MRRLSCVCSAPDPYALLEALLARKLTAKMVVDFGKDKAQKWVSDKLTPKESLLASMGAEDHDFMVSMFALHACKNIIYLQYKYMYMHVYRKHHQHFAGKACSDGAVSEGYYVSLHQQSRDLADAAWVYHCYLLHIQTYHAEGSLQTSMFLMYHQTYVAINSHCRVAQGLSVCCVWSCVYVRPQRRSGVQSKPFLSYGVLVVNLAVYAAGLGLRFSLGESSGEDYFYMLAKVNDEIVQGEYYRCEISSSCLTVI